jgi:hypothetical protein
MRPCIILSLSLSLSLSLCALYSSSIQTEQSDCTASRDTRQNPSKTPTAGKKNPYRRHRVVLCEISRPIIQINKQTKKTLETEKREIKFYKRSSRKLPEKTDAADTREKILADNDADVCAPELQRQNHKCAKFLSNGPNFVYTGPNSTKQKPGNRRQGDEENIPANVTTLVITREDKTRAGTCSRWS